MEKNIAVQFDETETVFEAVVEGGQRHSITSMTEAFFGLKAGTLSARKLTIDDQEYKWGDERHREERGTDESVEETSDADTETE